MRLLTVFTIFLLTTASVFADPVDYSLPDLKGKMHSLAEYKGKWVIVNYWATWCPPCQEEIPDLVDFHDRHKGKDAVVLGINFEDIGDEQLQTFVDSFLISYPVLRSSPAATTPLGPIPGLPTTYIIDPDGSPVARQVGPVTGKQLDDYIAGKTAKRKGGSS
ncbi:MAG: TlpA family protein disulfide reductase [Thiogranum sp.]|jgi:thiol-disulfide isomerase/thioredoxin|nr:TlpA family protein disulfide reductase [Thiogranum sp.]